MIRLRGAGMRWAVSLLLVLAILNGAMRDSFAAIVAGSPAGNVSSAASSLSWSHTVPSGSNRLLVVRVANIDTNVSVSNVTYGGTALTQLSTVASSGGTASGVRASVWYLVAPAVGTGTVQVTLSGSTHVQAGSQDYSGVAQATPFGTVATSNGASTNAPSVAVAAASGDSVIDLVALQGVSAASLAAGSGQSNYASSTGSSSSDVVGAASSKAGAASTTMSWSASASSPWAQIGVALKVAAGTVISGTVFEDINYGGGAGRSLASSGGTGASGATVELYSSAGAYVSTTTTASDGSYSFSVAASATYYVRVVGTSVASTRTGSLASLAGVMTYRTNASSGSAVAVTDYVGGTNPALADPGAAGSGAAFNTSTFVYSAGLSGTAQSVAPVAMAAAAISGVDFGFNFDTVVNTNDSGPGSLRQAMTNANTLGGDGGLAQSGRTAARESLVFMISNGTTGGGGSLNLSGGLRTANNYFTTSAGAYNVATITPASLLPTVSTALTIDAQAQPGWTLAPLVELNGANVGTSNANGFNINATSTVRGFVINRFASVGINVNGSGGGSAIAGNYLGTNASGSTASANGKGVFVSVAGLVIGGTTAAARNVISGNTLQGIDSYQAGSHTIQGNYIGTNAAGTAAVGNGLNGIIFNGAGASGSTVGGTAAGAGNLISGNSSNGIYINSPTGASNTIQGNTIGLNAAGTAALPNSYGVWIEGNTNTVGGTGAGQGNTISGNTYDGIGIKAQSGQTASGNAILGNAIYGNGSGRLGIDLLVGGVAGATANTGSKTASYPNQGMNTPVFTSATLVGTTLTVGGYVGSAAGQSTFASSRVEIFKSDNSIANGSGQAYLGFLTADASGNFSGSVTTSTLAAGNSITGTATDGSNNTSEFGPNFTPASAVISGTVFEDVNYGGGAGRSLAASSGTGVTGVTVELYNGSGTYVSSTTTSGAGAYGFGGLAAGSYVVRVASGTVASTRTGSTSALRGVMTFRTTAASGSAVAATDAVGGTDPAQVDPGTASGGAAFNTGTFVYTSGLSGTAQAVAPVTVSSGNIAGIDFGFNFDTVVNTNDSGQGSLRQAITNANALGSDASLAQSGRTAGIENLVFMIGNGTAGSGLRSGYNYFTTSAGSYNVATIAPASGLPSVSAALVIDAQTQPGWTANPLIELNGAGAGSGHGLTLSASGSIVRGLVINRFSPASGIGITAAGNTVQGCWIGTNAAGTAASANASAGIYITSNANLIGGTTAAQRNVISGNGSGYGTNNAGVLISSGAGNTVQGNYIGLNSTGNSAIANRPYGLDVTGTGTTIGGTVSGAGNVVSGNTLDGIILRPGSDNSLVQGNIIGTDPANAVTLANGRIGVDLQSNNNTVGGTATNAPNLIRGNSSNGITVLGGAATGNLIRGNSIYGNGGIGIDLGNDGLTANDGAKTSGQPNLLMDYPVFTSASLSGTTLTVAGYVGSAASQSTFASARVEVFISDATNTNGQGKTYLGYVTTDASGNFNGSVTGVSGITAGTSNVTGTATDGSNNTSEFGPNLVAGYALSGTVFEDLNYGGGAGRSLATSGGSGTAGATVELYNSSGSYVGSTTTASGGGYSFYGLTAGTYFVRVVSTSVPSTRTGSTGALVGVLTYRTTATSGSAVAQTDHVGGTNPALADPGAASSGAAFNTTTFVYGAGLSGTAQNVAPVTVGSASISGIDFGFNFSTVVNTNDSGQGSLRQFLLNATALTTKTGLVQAGSRLLAGSTSALPSAVETSIFMIGNGSAHAGLRAGLANQLTAGGWARITLASALPNVPAGTVLDGATQTANIGDTQSGQVGTGGTVGVSATVLGLFDKPEIELSGSYTVTVGGSGGGLRAVALKAGTAGLTAANTDVSDVLVGMAADGTSDATTTGTTYGVAVSGNTGQLVHHNDIRASDTGVRRVNAGSGTAIIEYNEVRAPASGQTGPFDGVLLASGVNDDIRYNLIAGLRGTGYEVSSGVGSGLVFEENTVSGNGLYNGTASSEPSGITICSATANTVTIRRNIISGNAGPGISVGQLRRILITQNAIYGNGAGGVSGIGIDLDPSGHTCNSTNPPDGVTANTGTKTSSLPNSGMNFPVFSGASLAGTTLSVSGYVGSAAGQSAFANSKVEVFVSDGNSSGYGAGQTYLGYLTANASGNFSGTLSVPGGVTITTGTTKITGTATDTGNNTSEFGPNVTVASLSLSGTVFEDINYGGGGGRNLAASGGSGVTGATVELYSSGGAYVSSTTTASGGYSFSGLSANTAYYVRVAGPTVASTRSGAAGTLAGVMTYRTTAASGSAVAVTDYVGGTNPAVADPGAASSGAAFNTSTFVFGSGLSGTAQAVTPASIGTASISGLDFGFNFDTVVNINDNGAGSLRQAITNANTLGSDALLAQSGRTAGIENLVFMIANGSTGSGLRGSFNLFVTAAGSYNVATIAPTSVMPSVTAPLVIDAQTQPGWTLAPLIELNGASAGSSSGLTLNAAGSTLRGFVINRFVREGVESTAGAGLVIQGNYIGLNAAGTAASANGYSGIWMNSNAGGHQIGGTAAAQRNVIAGQTTYDGIAILGGSGSVIQGNTIGANAAGTAAIANGRDGVKLYGGVSNTTVGGTATAAGNLIRASGGRGVNVLTGATGIAILGNGIYGNGNIGIDLDGDGQTSNDGAKTGGRANLDMDYPVFTSASLSGTTLNVAGYVGSAASQSAFASARVEVFISDQANPNGQGKTYLGYLTTDASGNFSGAITGVSGITAGTTKITGTATDGANNTSEFGPNLSVASLTLSGTVFEDRNYGGGAGRSLGGSGGTGVSGATVELYNSSGSYVSSTTTASGGSYTLSPPSTGTFYVRVAGSTVLSTRSGSTGSLVGVLTYRTDASSGSPVAVTNVVGGTNPGLADPGAAGSGAAFSTGSFVYSTGLSGTAQAVAPVAMSATSVSGVDFGFNFDTVVNTNDSGQGSLRQAITNANALGGDSALAQSGRTAAIENLVFMIANGTSAAGLRSAYNYFTTSAGSSSAATISPASALPAVSSALVIDGQTQPGWSANPIIELRGSGAGAVDGLTLTGSSTVLRGLVINRFGGNGLAVTGANNVIVQGCWIGVDATGTGAAGNTGHGISQSGGGNDLKIGGTTATQRNVLSGNGAYGIVIVSGGSHVIAGNYVGTSALGDTAVGNAAAGMYLKSALTSAIVGGTAAGEGNVVSGNNDGMFLSSGTITVQGNYIGLNAAGTAALGNRVSGMYVTSSGHVIGGTTSAARNVISGNGGRGIWLNTGSNTVQGNYVGTNATGTAAVPNSDGIYSKGTNNLIGGTVSGAGNLSSGNTQNGILLNAIASGTVVQGNVVGLNASGNAALPNGTGINVSCTTGCSIGGTASGAANVVSGNTGNGVSVTASSSGNAILENSIYANGGIGIDLGADGISANDGAKTNGAANLLMDSPVFTLARARGNQLTVAGYIGTAAGQSAFASSRVEIFASDATRASGSGKTFLGALTSDASGNIAGTITMSVSAIRIGTVLTATATDTSGNTSEFGVNFTGLIVDLVVNSNADGDDANPGDGLCQTATANECTLRAALTELNALAVQSTPPTIAFAIPGCTSGSQPACVITPVANLPAATRAISVDASTQTGYAGTPMIEINGGSNLAGTPIGLQFTVAGSTARGFRFTGWSTSAAVALEFSGADDGVVEANWFGLNASGSAGAASANRIGIALLNANGGRIGGSTSAQRNVVANGTSSGILLHGGSGNSVLGNYIGTDPSGNTAAGNGVGITNETSASLIGGTAAGSGNLFAGNATAHLLIDTDGGAVPTASATVHGNRFGLAANATTIGSATDAIRIGAATIGSVIGGTATGAGNVITGSAGQGVGVDAGGGTRVTIEGNAIYGNTLLGIDLGRDGVSANDGAYGAAAPNQGMDFPVFTSAGYDPASRVLTVTGYVGTGTGQAIFAGARVEIMTSDGDPSGFGEGSAFVGYLTADADGRFSGSVPVPAGVGFAVGTLLTGTATDTAGNTSEFGPNTTTTTMSALAPSQFNAFETSTAAGAVAGVLQTRVAGTAGSVAVIAIDATGAALKTSFAGTVTLDWMKATDNSGTLDAGNCRSSWVAVGNAGSMSFSAADVGRHSGTITPTTVGREWRLRISYAGPSGTVASCSTDPFAVRPASLAISAVSDADDATAGTTRALDNLAASGGRVHRAGRPFSLRAAANDAAGALATGYDGTPQLAVAGCVLPASGCVAGTLSAPALTASNGAIAADTLAYSEVGAINLQLTDDSFAAIDAADTPLAQRRIQSAAVGVGRFEPDHYLLAAANTPQFATQQGTCAQTGLGFTFVGQTFGWTRPPAFTVTAQNAAGATTAMWSGDLQKLAPAAAVARSLAASNAQDLTPVTTWGTMTLTDVGGGVASIAMAGDQFMFPRDSSTPVASFNPLIAVGIAVSDGSESGVSGNNPVTSSSALAIGSGTGIAFDLGSTFDYARLKLQNAFGDVRYGVSANVELQKFTARGWMRLAEDNTCVTVPQSAIAFSAGTGTFAGNLCSAPAAASVALRQGRGTLVLPKTLANVQGTAQLTLNIGSTLEGSACASGVPVAPVSAAWQHLRTARGTGGTQDQNPAAQLVWGRQHRDFIAQRELF